MNLYTRMILRNEFVGKLYNELIDTLNYWGAKIIQATEDGIDFGSYVQKEMFLQNLSILYNMYASEADRSCIPMHINTSINIADADDFGAIIKEVQVRNYLLYKINSPIFEEVIRIMDNEDLVFINVDSESYKKDVAKYTALFLEETKEHTPLARLINLYILDSLRTHHDYNLWIDALKNGKCGYDIFKLIKKDEFERDMLKYGVYDASYIWDYIKASILSAGPYSFLRRLPLPSMRAVVERFLR